MSKRICVHIILQATVSKGTDDKQVGPNQTEESRKEWGEISVEIRGCGGAGLDAVLTKEGMRGAREICSSGDSIIEKANAEGYDFTF